MEAETPLVQIENLSHSFGDGALAKCILRNISIEFRRGEIVMIVGPSGSGKTTFLSLLGALRVVEQGTIHFEGREISAANAENLVLIRRDVGFVFQAHNLIASLTACENVQMPLQFALGETASSSRAKSLEMLRLVGIEEHADKIPARLSGGQRQRVAIARALVRGPKLILADEPTASLDKNTGREVVDILQRLARKFHCTILVVTHDHRILDIADRVILLEDGAMEDLETRLEGLLDQIAGIVGLLPAALNNENFHAAREAGDEAFLSRLEGIERRVHDLGHLKTRPGLAHRVDLLQQILSQIRMLRDSVKRLGELLAANPIPDLAPMVDRFFQGGETLLLTAGDAFRDREDLEIQTLLGITQDRREMMTRLRDSYFEAQSHLAEEGKVFLFDLTNTFARVVYLLNSLAKLLANWR
jgi:putative ABC transport system ATP-binding protein